MDTKQIVKKFKDLSSERGTLESKWQDITKYGMPREAIVTASRSLGSEFDTDVYDSTAITSAVVFAAGMHAYLTNPSTKWFGLRMKDEQLGQVSVVSEWLDNAEKVLNDVINSSNFSQQVTAMYRELGLYGTSCLYEEEDPKDILRFHSRPASEIYIVEDKTERVSEVYRAFQFTAQQAKEEFGDNAGEKVNQFAETQPLKKIDFLHYVGPRGVFEAGKKDSKNLPYESKWIELSMVHLAKEGGYDEFPFFVSRFSKNSMEKYGYSPAMTVLPDIRMVNKMKKTILQQGEKMIDPPLDLPEEGYLLPLDISAGAVNYHRLGMADNELVRGFLPDVSRGLPITQEMIKETQDTIKRAFFVDLFLMLTSMPKMTATEVMQRVNEKMLILSPVLGRLMSDFLDPMITRSFKRCLSNGKIPPPPVEAQGQDFTIKYVSPLARAQKAYESQSLQQFLGVITEMAQMSPMVLDKINVDKVVEEMADIQNIPAKMLRDDAEVAQIRAQRAEVEQQTRELAMAQQGADIAQKVGVNGK